LLGVTFWSDKPFEARNKAWAGIDEYISKNLRTLSYGTFETIAYKGEASPFREGVSFEREAVAHRFDASDQG
jgi:hypothetical protein